MNILVSPSDFVGQYDLPSAFSTTDIIQSYIDREEKKMIQRLLGFTLGGLLISYIALPKVPITVGPLVIGKSYKIDVFIAGDDFTNVGAASNASGIYFIATGTTPTVYANLSSLIPDAVKRYDDILNPFFFSAEECDCVYSNFNTSGNSFMESNGLKDMLLCDIYYCYLSEEQSIASMSGVASGAIENGNVSTMRNAYRKGEQKWNDAGLNTWYAIQWLCRIKSRSDYPDFTGTKGQVRYSSIIG